MTEHVHVDTELTRDQALEAVAEASELWGATWERRGGEGHLALPVLAGLRFGLLSGRVWVEPAARGSRIIFRIEASRYRLHWGMLAILVAGAAGGIAATLWPFYPPLLGIAPLAVVVALAAWILVASRLRTSTPGDFLDLVADLPATGEARSATGPVVGDAPGHQDE